MKRNVLKQKSAKKKVKIKFVEESLLVLHKKRKKLKFQAFDLFIDTYFFIRNLAWNQVLSIFYFKPKSFWILVPKMSYGVSEYQQYLFYTVF